MGVSWEASPPSRRAIVTAQLGTFVAGGMVLMKLLPFVPGHMTWLEASCLAAWMLLGLSLKPDSPGPVRQGVRDDRGA